MSYLTPKNVLSSAAIDRREMMLLVNVLDMKTKKADTETKGLLSKRKTLSVKAADSSSSANPAAASLDSALCGDVIKTYSALQKDGDEHIQLFLDKLAKTERSVRLCTAVSLLDNVSAPLPAECVFMTKPGTLVVKSRNKSDEEHGDYVAACVRVGGKYAVAMRRGNKSGASPMESEYIFDKPPDKVFPTGSRDSFVLDNSYPLVGFEEIQGNTYAVFLTGLGLKRGMPKRISSCDTNSGIHEIIVTGHRVAKIPLLCLFETVKDIAGMKFTSTVDDFMSFTQPMDIDECDILTNQLKSQIENDRIAKEADEVEHRVDVYEHCQGRTNVIFSLTAFQSDEIGKSWCNCNASRSVKSGGFSGLKDNVNPDEMNDVSCFSDCIDVTVNQDQEKNCCVTIETGRRLFEASPAPFTRKDADKYEPVPSTSSASPSSAFLPIVSPLTEEEEEEEEEDDDDDDDDDCSDKCASNKKKRIPFNNNNNNKQIASQRKSFGIRKFMLVNPGQEADVIEKLVKWNQSKHIPREYTTSETRNAWWCSFSPPLKVDDVDTAPEEEEEVDEEEEEEKNREKDDNNEQQEHEEHQEVKAAVRSVEMLNNMSNEVEIVELLQRALSAALTLKTNKIQNNKHIVIKLENSLKELDKFKQEYDKIWSKESVHVAKSLLVDEAAASSIAQLIASEITKTGVLEGIGNDATSILTGKNDGVRKYMSGNRTIGLSNLKPSEERGIDIVLKEWIKSKIPVTPAYPNVFAIKKNLMRSSFSLKRKVSSYSSSRKIMKTEDGFAPSFSSEGEEEEEEEEEEEKPIATVSTASEFVSVTPPSFIKLPRFNNGEIAEHLADALGRQLCGMKKSPSVYQRMCAVINTLKAKLIDGPSRRFSTQRDIESRLFTLPKVEDVQRVVVEEEEGEEESVSVLSYETEKFNGIFRGEESNNNNNNNNNHKRFSQKLKGVLKTSASWILKTDDQRIKTIIAVTTLRRIYEEHYAYSKLVYLFLFNKLKRELEGNASSYDSTFAAAFNWYCAVVARNRICDVFALLPGPKNNTGEDVPSISELSEKLFENKVAIGVIINKIIDSIRWMINTKIPAGFLKGLQGDGDEDNAGSGEWKKNPCETIDETSKFVVPSLKIGTNRANKAVRVSGHVLGPISVPVNFTSLGLDAATTGKLLINAVTGKGLLTVSPEKVDCCDDDGEPPLFKAVADLINQPSLCQNRTKSLTSFAVSPSHPSGGGGAFKGGRVFDKRAFQDAAALRQISPPQQNCRKPWCDIKFEKSRNMWRAGFVVPKKMCEIILRNKGNVTVEATPNKKSKMTQSKADASCCATSPREIEKISRAISLFSPNEKIFSTLAKSLTACAPGEVDLKVMLLRSDDTTDPLVTCSMTQEACQSSGLFDVYNLAFFNYVCRSIKIHGEWCARHCTDDNSNNNKVLGGREESNNIGGGGERREENTEECCYNDDDAQERISPTGRCDKKKYIGKKKPLWLFHLCVM